MHGSSVPIGDHLMFDIDHISGGGKSLESASLVHAPHHTVVSCCCIPLHTRATPVPSPQFRLYSTPGRSLLRNCQSDPCILASKLPLGHCLLSMQTCHIFCGSTETISILTNSNFIYCAVHVSLYNIGPIHLQNQN